MKNDGSQLIALLTALLVVLLIIMGSVYILFGEGDFGYKEVQRSTADASDVVIQGAYSNEKEYETSKTVIVSDRFVGEIDEDAQIIALTGNGDYYIVRKGTVLAGDTVLTPDSVYRFNNPEKSAYR